jgi:hypothetical protein
MSRLKIIPISNIIPLMDFEEEKVSLVSDLIRESGNISRPVPLVHIEGRRYLLLDDSSILESANRLKILYLPAQVTTPGKLTNIQAEAYTEGWSYDLLENFLRLFPRSAVVCNQKRELKHFTEPFKLAFRFKGESDIYVCFRRCNSNEVNGALFDFFKYLSNHARLSSIFYTGSVKTANLKKSDEICLLKVLDFDFDDILKAALFGYRFPAGLFQFDFGCRIIGVDYPVSILNERASIREKEKFFRDLVSYRFLSGYPEFIGSGVYLLNHPIKK